jgi:NADH-quinone oxidoreductase subunit C
MNDASEAALRLKEAFPEKVEDMTTFRGDTTLLIRKEDLVGVGRFLKEEPELAFDYLILVTAVDELPKEPRFAMFYHLYSMKYNQRLCLKVHLSSDEPVIESVTSVWPTANWHEREAFDLMGIEFLNHPDLRRIFMPDDWQGHPLRKDYPLRGPERSG